jgi:hypothetical protein
MASFTDTVPQFNPYVEQLPIEAMVKVGTYKQEKYEEGIKKIQGYIDNIAGLDIYKDIHKEYLQSKLNELGNNLTKVAAGDFSNFQLVNSVSGMATQLIKDPIIQGAVSSTAKIRKSQEMLDADEKAGTLAPENKTHWSKQVNSWADDGDLKSGFNGSYFKYRDVFKKLGEIAKSVGEDSTIVQQLFQTDGDGNPVLKDGKLQLNDVMAETLLKGKDKNKLLQAFQDGLDTNDYKQLSITGEYKLSGKTAKELGQMIDDNFNELTKSVSLQKELIKDRIIKLKSNNGDQKEIDLLQEKLVTLDNNLKKRKESNDALASSGADAVRSSIYTNNYIDGMADALSTKETYTKYSKNPAVEMMLDREKLKLQVAQEQRARDLLDYTISHDKDQMAFDKWKVLFEKGLVDEKGNPTGASLYGGAARDLPVPDVSSLYFSNQFEKGLAEDKDAQFKMYEKVAIAYWVGAAAASGNKTPYTEAQTIAGMKSEAKRQGMSYNDFVVLQGEKASDNFYSNHSVVGPEFSETFLQINSLRHRIGINEQKRKGEIAYIKANAQGFKPFDMNSVNVQPIDIEMNVPTTYVRGKESGYVKQKLHLTKEDLYNFALAEGSWLSRQFSSAEEEESAKNASAALVKKFGSIAAVQAIGREANKRKSNLLGIVPFSGVPLEPESTNPFIKLIANDNFKKTMRLREEYYKGISEVGAPKGVPLYKDKEADANHLATGISSIVSDYSGINSDYEKFAKGAQDKKAEFQINIDPATSRYGKNTYNLQMTDSEGAVTTLPIEESHFKFLTGRQAPIVFDDDIKSTIKAFKTGSTNQAYNYMDPDSAHTTAYLKDNDFQNVRNYTIAMDYTMGGNGKYYPKIYLKDNENWKLIQYGINKKGFAGLTKEEALLFPSYVDDSFIKSILIK